MILHYPPIDYNLFLLIAIVTDGDPDNTDPNRDAAVEAVLRHCERGGDCENLIAPYIIGVGEEVAKAYLDRFAKEFTGEAITIEGDISEQKALFNEIFLFIGESIKNSLAGNHDLRSLYEKLSKKGTAQVKKTKKGVHLL